MPTNRHPFVPALVLLVAAPLGAHCDALDGPVVTAARKALDTGKVEGVLVWVRPSEEAEVRQAFARTLGVRRLGPEAKELADRYFFETLVRLHRAGEGASYTGLKPAGQDLGPAIPAADKALESGDLTPVRHLLREALQEGLDHRFHRARATKHHAPADLAAGREHVEAYVAFLHYVEGAYEALAKAGGHHHE